MAAAEEQTRLQIGHVLFIDIVGYSKLLVNQQSELLRELNEVVSGTNEFREAEAEGKLIRLPTGDGMALVFRTNPEAAAQCAVEIARALKEHPRITLRMGIHSGPVNEVVDVNQRQNIAGAGINMAQRVMDCGDAGHILVSKHVAEDLEQHDRWRPLLHELGTCEVKHGVRIDISNLYSDEVGNPQLPKKLEAVRKHRAHVRWAGVAIGLLVVGAIVAALMIVSRRPTTSLTAIPEKSIAVLPFVNMAADKEQEYFSDGISEELLNLLAKIPQLQVAARTSSFSFKGKEVAIPEIARQLHVAHVLEGSVRKAGDQVRITAQLIKAGRRLPPVVADLRPQARRHLRDPGRDRGRRGEAAQGDAARRGAEGAHDRSGGLRALPAGRPARTAEHCRGAPSSPMRFTARCWRSIRATPRPGTGWPATSSTRRAMGLLPSKEGYARAREAADEGARDRSGVRAGPCPARLDRDVWRQRPRRRGASTSSARWRSIRRISTCCATAPRCSAVSAALRRGAGARRGRRPPRSGERDARSTTWATHQRSAGRLDAAIASLPHRAEPEPGPGQRALPTRRWRCC